MGANVDQYKRHFSFQEQFQPGAKMRKELKYTNGLLFFPIKICYSYNHGIIQEIQNLGYISLFKKVLKTSLKNF